MPSKKIVWIVFVIGVCAILAALLWSRTEQESQPLVTPAPPRTETDRLVTPYGYDAATTDLGTWRMVEEVKAEVEGKEGCGAISPRNGIAYVPTYFGDGARCEVVRKDGVTIAYGVGYSAAYEGLNHLSAEIYVFRNDGFFILENPSGLPDLRTFTPEQEQALREFDRAHQAYFAGPSWKAYDELNRSYLRKELEAPSPRVAEAMAVLQTYVESLRF